MADFQFVTPQLAVGSSIGTPENMKEVAKSGITHIVNMQIEFDDRMLTDGTAIQILDNGRKDDFLPKPPGYFRDGVMFTMEALRDPRSKVLFHCAAGVHRSPLMLFAVLRVLGYDPSIAMEMILAARPQSFFHLPELKSVDAFVAEFQELRGN